MGGFLYFRKSENEDAAAYPAGYRASHAVMESKGLECKSRLVRDAFELCVYKKMRVETDSVLEFDSGDFVVATGTMIYKKRMGKPALQMIYSDFCNNGLSFEHFIGHFAVWIMVGDELVVFNDYRRMYQVCHNADQSVVASAFLPVCETLATRTPNTQEIFEYLTFDSIHGNRSIIQEVDYLDSKFIHQLLPLRSTRPKKLSLPVLDGDRTFDLQVQDADEVLREYFAVLADNFGDKQSLGLTGGFDSRLTLAYLQKAGVQPYLYVQGAPESADVRLAKLIAKGEGFDIHYDSDETSIELSPDEFEKKVRLAYFYLDGMPHFGVFDPWALVSDDRRRQSRSEWLRLYGMGAEVFRTTINLPDRSCSLADYLASSFDKYDLSSYGPRFEKRAFFAAFGDKISKAMNLETDMMTRTQLELAYRDFRLTRGAGPQMTLQNERAFALVPYTEPVFPALGAGIPIRYKILGRFEAELIKQTNPRLASYPSAYGYAFSDGPNLKTRVSRQLKQHLPKSVRPFLNRQKFRMKGSGKLPYFVAEEYIRRFFPHGFPNIEPFVDVRSLRNHRQLSRALSLELILAGSMGDL